MAGIQRVDIGGSYLKDTSPVGSFADMLMQQGAQWQKQAADEKARELAQQKYETELGFKQRAEDRQIDELKRQQNARDALVNYKFDPTTALDKQRELADQALISKYEELNKKAAEDPSFNPALDAEEARQLQSFYEQQTPWQEQVQATVYNDLIAKGVDDKSALARATALATPYKSLKEAQATEDLLAKTTNEARDKAFDRKLKMIDMTRKLIDESGSGSSKDGKAGGNLAELIAKLGNSSASLNAAITEARKVEGVTDKDIVNGLVALGAKEGINWYDLTDYGKKDVDLSRLPEAIELVKSGKSNVNKDKADILAKLTALENSYGKTGALDVEEEAKKRMGTGMEGVLDKIFGKSAGTTDTTPSASGKGNQNTSIEKENIKTGKTDLFDEAQPYIDKFDERMQKVVRDKYTDRQWSDYSISDLQTMQEALGDTNVDKELNAEIEKAIAAKRKSSLITIDGKALEELESPLSRFDKWVKETTYNKDGTLNNAGVIEAIAKTAGTTMLPGGFLGKFGGKVRPNSSSILGNKFRQAGKSPGEELLDLVNKTNLKNSPKFGDNVKNVDNAVPKVKDIINNAFGKRSKQLSDATRDYLINGKGNIPIGSKNEADKVWKAALNARKNNVLNDEQLGDIIRQLNDSGYISTRKLMEEGFDLFR